MSYLLVLSILVISGCSFLKKDSKETASGYSVFKSKHYGASISYPSNWDSKINADDRVVDADFYNENFFYNENLRIKLRISPLQDNESITLDEWAELKAKDAKSFGDTILGTGSIRIAGLDGKYLSHSRNGKRSQQIIGIGADKITVLINVVGNEKDFDLNREEIARIIDSVKIRESKDMGTNVFKRDEIMIEHPKTWTRIVAIEVPKAFPGEDGFKVILFNPVTGTVDWAGLNFVKSVAPHKTLAENVNSEIKLLKELLPEYRVIERKNTTLSGLPAEIVHYSYDSRNFDLTLARNATVIYSVKGEYIYAVIYYSRKWDFEANKPEFEKIVDSIKIDGQSEASVPKQPATNPPPSKPIDTVKVTPSTSKLTVSSKQELAEVLASAKDFNPNAHLLLVSASGDGNYGDPLPTEEARPIDGRLLRASWAYWFRDPSKATKNMFTVYYDKSKGLYVASDNVYASGYDKLDKGDITLTWNVDSDQAYQIAWDKVGAIREQYFDTDHASYTLQYDYLTNTKDLIFMWVVKFSYKTGLREPPISDLKVYIDPETGEVLHVNLKDLSQRTAG